MELSVEFYKRGVMDGFPKPLCKTFPFSLSMTPLL